MAKTKTFKFLNWLAGTWFGSLVNSVGYLLADIMPTHKTIEFVYKPSSNDPKEQRWCLLNATLTPLKLLTTSGITILDVITQAHRDGAFNRPGRYKVVINKSFSQPPDVTIIFGGI